MASGFNHILADRENDQHAENRHGVSPVDKALVMEKAPIFSVGWELLLMCICSRWELNLGVCYELYDSYRLSIVTDS